MNTTVKNEMRLDEGDTVTTCKIPGPDMVIGKLVRERDITAEKREVFKGVECWWFDKNNCYCKAIFHVKDLRLLKSVKEN